MVNGYMGVTNASIIIEITRYPLAISIRRCASNGM